MVVFLIGRELFSPVWAFLASALFFCSPFFQMTAPNFMSHTTASFYLAAGFYTFLRMHRQGAGHWTPLLGGAFLGLLFSTRPLTSAAIGAAYGLYMAYSLYRGSERERGRLLKIYALFFLALLLLPMLSLVNNYALMGHPLESPYGAAADRVLGGELDWERLSKALLDNFTLSALFLMLLFGWAGSLTTVSLFGVFLPPGPDRKAFLLTLSIAVVFLAYMAYSISSVTIMYGPRYVFEVAFLYVLIWVMGLKRLTEAVDWIADAILKVGARNLRSPGIRIGPFLSVLLILFSLWSGAASFASWKSPSSQPWPGNAFVPQNVSQMRGFNFTSPVVQKLIAAHQLSNALIFVEGPLSQWWPYGSVFFENEPTFDGDIVYAIDKGAERNMELISAYPGRRYFRVNYQNKAIWELDSKSQVLRSLK